MHRGYMVVHRWLVGGTEVGWLCTGLAQVRGCAQRFKGAVIQSVVLNSVFVLLLLHMVG